MKPRFVSDSLGGLNCDTILNHAARLDLSGVEVNTCGGSTAPQFDLKGMPENKAKQAAFLAAFADRRAGGDQVV